MSTRRSRAIIDDVRARGDAALIDYTSSFDRADLTRRRIARRRRRDRRGRTSGAIADDARGADSSRATASRRITSARSRTTTAIPMRSASSSARAGRRSRRSASTCRAARRPIRRSVLMNAVPAEVAGVERIVMVVPTPGRRDQPAGAGRGQARRRRRDLPHRRRAGDRGARLRHRDDRAGRQDRRAGQRLCRRRQAAGLRHGRHRHDRRAVRGAGHRRRRQRSRTGSPPTSSRRPSTTPRRSRSSSPTTRRLPMRRGGGRAAARTSLPRAEIAARELARFRRDHPRRRSRSTAIQLVNRIAPEHLELAVDDPEALPRQDPQCRRDLPRPPHAGGRSATMSAARTTCCRPRARRASPRASRCSTS